MLKSNWKMQDVNIVQPMHSFCSSSKLICITIFLQRQTKQISASHPNFSKKQYANKCSLRILYTLFDTVDLWLTKTNLCGCKDTQTKQDFCLNESQSCLLRLFTSETSSISRRQYHSNCDMHKLGLNYWVQNFEV